MLTFYFVRHGNKETIPFDPPLTEVGAKQAEITAEHLRGIHFELILASPKLRARQTAEIISKHHTLSVTTDKRLIERLEWENDESFGDFIIEWNKTDIDRSYRPKKSVSSSENGKQIRQLLYELSVKYLHGNILIITHGGTIGDLLRELFTEQAINHKTEPLSGAKYIDILECSITIIKKHENKYELVKLGDISHYIAQ